MIPSSKTRFAALFAFCASALLPAPLLADTLAETLINAYQLSPYLEASRAGLRAQDEGVALARAGGRPAVSAGLSANVQAKDSNAWALQDSYRASLDAALTLYDGGATKHAISAAIANVQAGRAGLRQTEQQVLYDAVSAYMGVRRDTELTALSRGNVNVLRQQVQAAKDRFEVGEVTRTDVSLAEARQAAADADLATSTGRLAISGEVFAAVVGVPPRNLQPPPPIPELPRTLADAEAVAMREHPAMVSARFAEEAAAADVARAVAGIGPVVALNGQVAATRSDDLFGTARNDLTAQAGISATIPIYQGGSRSAQVRQAQALLAVRKYELQAAARNTRQNVATTWANLAVSRASIRAGREQVAAAEVTLNGVREEALLGARTTLDVLDREQELRDARFRLVSARHDEYVTAYALLASMGLLTVKHLNLGIPTYDPEVNFQNVQNAPYSSPQGAVVDRLEKLYGP